MLIFVTFVVLFSGAQQKLDSHPPYPPNIATTTLPVPTPTSPPLPPSASPTICLTPSCILISAQILSQIDTSVDPCEDPYGWATGGWRKRNPLPPSKGVWNSFHLLASQNQRVLLDVLREEESKGADEVLEMVKGEVESDEGRARSENVEKLRKVFKGCVDQVRENST
jgi:endothelin-converting enzyme